MKLFFLEKSPEEKTMDLVVVNGLDPNFFSN